MKKKKNKSEYFYQKGYAHGLVDTTKHWSLIVKGLADRVEVLEKRALEGESNAHS